MADKRDNDITDLTEDEDVGGKGTDKSKEKSKDKSKGKSKKENAPSQPAQQSDAGKPEKKGKAGKEKAGKQKQEKKGGKLKLKLILITVPVLLVAGFVAALIINIFGIRDIVGGFVKDPIIGVVVWFDAEFKSVDDELRAKNKEREAEIEKRATGLNEREKGIGEREAQLDERKVEQDTFGESLTKRESQLDRRSKALDVREEQMDKASNPAEPLYHRVMSEQELADIQSLSRSYAQMAPEAAAEILVKLKDEQHVAVLLYHMTERNAAAILAVMDSEFAAKMTDILLS